MVIVSASLFVIGIPLGGAGAYTVKLLMGIVLSEFKDYDAWLAVSVSRPDDAGG